MNKGHIFFQGVGGQNHPQERPMDPTYIHNSLILEMANNWPWVRWMMDKHKHNELKQVDPMEKDWLKFVLENKIDVEKYGKDEEKFVEEHYKKTTT